MLYTFFCEDIGNCIIDHTLPFNKSHFTLNSLQLILNAPHFQRMLNLQTFQITFFPLTFFFPKFGSKEISIKLVMKLI